VAEKTWVRFPVKAKRTTKTLHFCRSLVSADVVLILSFSQLRQIIFKLLFFFGNLCLIIRLVGVDDEFSKFVLQVLQVQQVQQALLTEMVLTLLHVRIPTSNCC
jgi:hypothetical protein